MRLTLVFLSCIFSSGFVSTAYSQEEGTLEELPVSSEEEASLSTSDLVANEAGSSVLDPLAVVGASAAAAVPLPQDQRGFVMTTNLSCWIREGLGMGIDIWARRTEPVADGQPGIGANSSFNCFAYLSQGFNAQNNRFTRQAYLDCYECQIRCNAATVAAVGIPFGLNLTDTWTCRSEKFFRGPPEDPRVASTDPDSTNEPTDNANITTDTLQASTGAAEPVPAEIQEPAVTSEGESDSPGIIGNPAAEEFLETPGEEPFNINEESSSPSSEPSISGWNSTAGEPLIPEQLILIWNGYMDPPREASEIGAEGR